MLASLADLADRLRAFADDRGWRQFHTPKNLAMALAGETGELLAELQWLTPEQSQSLDDEARLRVATEMADVLIYLVRMADVLDVDLLAAAETKIAHNARRYPADTWQGSARKAPPLD